VAVSEFLSCRPNLEVDDLVPAAAFLCEVLGFEVEVDEPAMGLILLRRDAVGLALVQSAASGVNATTTAYIGVTGVDELHEQCTARGVRIVTGLTDHPWGLRDFVIEIPGGHRLALGERITQPRLRRPEPAASRPGRSAIGPPRHSSNTRRCSQAIRRFSEPPAFTLITERGQQEVCEATGSPITSGCWSEPSRSEVKRRSPILA
jgi:predicted enzyme related to lactoylglutathione lyase